MKATRIGGKQNVSNLQWLMHSSMYSGDVYISLNFLRLRYKFLNNLINDTWLAFFIISSYFFFLSTLKIYSVEYLDYPFVLTMVNILIL